MKKWKVFLTLAIGTISLFSQVNAAHAEESTSALKFSAEAQLPKNQVDSNISYFDVGLNPNEEEILHVKLTNTSSKEVIVDPSINRARTNAIGVVEYNRKTKKLTSNAKENIENLATINEKEIRIPANGVYDLQIHVQMPKEKLSGVQAGAIYLLQKDSTNNSGNIKNQYAQEIGLILQSSNPNQIPSQLNLKKAKAGQMNARNTALLTLENDQPKFMKLTNIKASMINKESGKTIHKTSQANMTVAPNTNFDFPISLNGKEFEPGTYTVKFEANEGAKKWELSNEFDVKKEKSQNLNANDAVLKNKPSFFEQNKVMLSILSLMIIILISLGAYVVKLRRTNIR